MSPLDVSLEHPKHMLKIMGKKIVTFLAEKFCLSKPMLSNEHQVSLNLHDETYTWPCYGSIGDVIPTKFI